MNAYRPQQSASRPARSGRRLHGPRLQPLLRLLPRLMVLSLAIFGLLFSLVTSYRLTVPTTQAAWAAAGFIALFFIVFTNRRMRLMLIICLSLTILWVWRNAQPLMQGMLLLLDQVLTPMTLRLPDALQGLLTVSDAAEAAALTAKAFNMLLFFATLLAGYFVVYRSSLLGLALATLPLLLPAPFYALSPAVLPFFCFVAAYLMLYIGNLGKYLPLTTVRPKSDTLLDYGEETFAGQRASQRVLSIAALPLIALALLLSSLLLPEASYVRPLWIETLQEKILSLELDGDLFQGSNDGLTHGDFNSLANIRFTGETVLKVRVSEPRPLYMRDFAGVSYTANGWLGADHAAYRRAADGFYGIAPQNLHAAAFPQGSAYALSVRNIAALPTSLWTPNGLVTAADDITGATFLQDTALGAARANGISQYTIEAMPLDTIFGSIPLAGGSTEADGILRAYLAAADSAIDRSAAADPHAKAAADAYLGYVFETYTALPQETDRKSVV